MNIIKTEFRDLYVIKPNIHRDDRGHFLETFNKRLFKQKTGLDVDFVQDNESKSKLGVLRGLHYQEGVFAQSKLVRVVEGSVLDVVVDMRPESDMYGKYFSIVLDGEEKTQLFVPKGFAHGFITLTPEATFSYKCDEFYNPDFEGGVYPFDVDLDIDWNFPRKNITIADKDLNLPTFQDATKKKVLVLGANGQLGRSIADLTHQYTGMEFTFLRSKDLDISNQIEVLNHFNKNHYDYVINCAAYTKVDEAEGKGKTKNMEVNAWGAHNVGYACKRYDITLIQISTDYVFDGAKNAPYKEDDKTNPLNEYGKAKVKSEFSISTSVPKHYIIRTSWLFSEFGNNFAKTMLKLGSEHDSLEVVGNQVGKPTYAGDLAEFILFHLIYGDQQCYGTYHFAGEDVVSWAEFAKGIMERAEFDTEIIRNDDYGISIAKRPTYSVLDTDYTSNRFRISIRPYKYGVDEMIGRLKFK